jgi:putative copper resistance protein D
MKMDYFYFHVLVLWLNVLGIALLVGSVMFRWAVLNRGLRVIDPASPELERVQVTSNRDLKRWMAGSLILLVVVSAPDLILRAQMMSNKPLLEVASVLPLVLLKTHMGKVWLSRMAILCLFGVLWFFIKKSSPSGIQPLLLLATAGLCLTTSLSGHAADKGDFTVPVAADWLHVMAVSSWIGSLVPLRFLLPKIITLLDKKSHLKLEAEVVQRFSSFAVRCVSILMLSGVYNAWLHVRTFSNLMTTPYGVTLLFKLAFVAPMLGLGALGRYYVRPALQTLVGEPVRDSLIGRMANRIISLLGGKTGDEDYRMLQQGYGSGQIAMLHLKIFVALECLLAIVVLGLTALLTQTSPPDLSELTPPGNPSDMMRNMGM